MKLKNISGRQLSVGVGRASVTIPHNGTATFADGTAASDDAKKYIGLGYLEMVEAPSIAEFEASIDVEDSILFTVAGQPTDGQIVTINGQVFEFDNNATVTAGRTLVTIGANSHATYGNLQTAINANSVLQGLQIKATDRVAPLTNGTLSRMVVRGIGTTAITQSTNATNLTIGPVAAQANEGYRQVMRSQVATGTTMLIDTGLRTIVSVLVQVRNAAGRLKNYDGAAVIGDGLVFLTDDDGAAGANTVDIASTDVVTIYAIGK